jgi:hypothetical protein
MKKQTFLKKIKKHLEDEGFRLVKTNGYNVYLDGIPCSGFFDENKKILKVAGHNSDWFSILVHEYCHFLQYINQTKYYVIYETRCNYDFFLWINREINLNKKTIRKIIYYTIDMELECEKMTVNLIKKYNLPINIRKYIRGANAYLLFHNYVLKYRRWYKTKPYHLEELENTMKPHFLKNYKKMTKNFENFITNNCI